MNKFNYALVIGHIFFKGEIIMKNQEDKQKRINPVSINKGIRKSLNRYKKEIAKLNPNMKTVSDALLVELSLKESCHWVYSKKEQKQMKKSKKVK